MGLILVGGLLVSWFAWVWGAGFKAQFGSRFVWVFGLQVCCIWLLSVRGLDGCV